MRRVLLERWKDLDIDRDGLKIYTPLSLEAYKFAEVAIHNGLEEIDKRRGWRGPIENIVQADLQKYLEKYGPKIPEELKLNYIYPAIVTKVNLRSSTLDIKLGEIDAVVDLSKSSWANKMINLDDEVRWSKPLKVLRTGDVIEVKVVKLPAQEENKYEVLLAQKPLLEGAIVLLNPLNGRVLTTIGGYDYSRSKFNRATQSLRQPGSAFKPIVYLAAIDSFGYTPSTIVVDEPRTFRVGDQYWSPSNFDDKYLGPITLRTALEKSRNLISADIIFGIGVEAAIRYARKLGISSNLGRNLSLSLGSSEVTVLEMARAYGVFASGGVLFKSVFVERIEDRFGNELFNADEETFENAEQVVSEQSAFIMANMMRGVVERGTGRRVKALERPVAGKTGTSNEQMDVWFVGYTPEYAAAVWVGFDQKKAHRKK